MVRNEGSTGGSRTLSPQGKDQEVPERLAGLGQLDCWELWAAVEVAQASTLWAVLA